MDLLPVPPSGLISSAPPGTWIALSADLQRIVAVADDPQDAWDKAQALGETDVVLDKTPPANTLLIL